jgi:hypothetical protein
MVFLLFTYLLNMILINLINQKNMLKKFKMCKTLCDFYKNDKGKFHNFFNESSYPNECYLYSFK